MNHRKERSRFFWAILMLLCATLAACSGQAPTGQRNTTSPSTTATDGNPARCKEGDASPVAPTGSGLQVVIDTSCVMSDSQFASGLTYIDNSLVSSEGTAAGNNVRTLLKGAIHFQNTHIMGWGMPDPWPDPSSPEPTNWGALDARMRLIVATGGTPVISLDEAPWWMKGVNIGRRPAQLLTADDEWATVAYESRILDNKMDAWLHLVQRVAERYMVPPYNVRYFQVWNEMKGYYDPTINNFDYTTSPGEPTGGPFAKHGYTYMYNRVYETLMKVATSHGIPATSIKVGGPYVVMDTWASHHISNPSGMAKPYGIFDQRPFDVIQYWLQHKEGAGFITMDASVENRDTNKLLTDPFTCAEKFSDIVKWIRSLDPTAYPGAGTLPIWLAEWFADPRNGGSTPAYDDAVKSYAMMGFIQAGGATALAWGNSGAVSTDFGLWSDPLNGNGQPYPWYFSLKALQQYFAAGAPLYRTSISDPKRIAALATKHKVILVNKTPNSLTVSVNHTSVSLAPYEVKLMDYAK